jgi:hypothetical protein
LPQDVSMSKTPGNLFAKIGPVGNPCFILH